MDISPIKIKKEEFIYALLSLILTVSILSIINYIIFLVYIPNIDEIIQQVSSVSVMYKSNFLPEPAERIQYILSVIFSPFIIFLSYLGVCKLLKDNYIFIKNLNFIYLIGVIISFIGTITLFCFILNQNNFFYPPPFYNNFFIYIICLLPCCLICIYISEKKEIYNKFFSIISGIISFILIGMVFVMSISNKNIYYGWIDSFNAVFYSVSQVFVGKTLLVDFNNQYGLYPHFLNPIFNIIDLTVLNYSIVMGILIAISFILLFISFKKIISNSVISFFGFTSIIFLCLPMMRIGSIGSSTSFDIFFQYWPLRTIFPIILIFLSIIYLKQQHKIIYYSLFIISSIAILWNLDTGIIVFISWMLLLLYNELYNNDKKLVIKNCILHLITGILILLSIFISYIIFIYIRSGSFPDFTLFVQYQQYFYISGFFMIPMKLFHPWNIIIIIYIIGLIYSIMMKGNIYISKIIFLLTILGFGLFSYYQGRSHDSVLLLVIYPAIFLLTIFLDICLNNIKKYGYYLYHNLIFIIIISFILSISICSIGYNFNQYYQYSERGYLSLNDSESSVVSDNINFIKNSTYKGEKILILSRHYDGLYYGESHTESILNIPGYTEILTIKDSNKISEFLINNTDTKVFFNPIYFWGSTISILPDLYNILNQNYSVTSSSTSNQMILLHRDFNKTKSLSIIPDMNIISRVNSEMIFVQPPIYLNNNFTIQMIVKSNITQLPYAIIVGNHPGFGSDISGFVIHRDNISNGYTFVFGNGKYWESCGIFYLTELKWNYIVITIENKKMLIYKDGELIKSYNMISDLKNSDMPLYIGNWYNGDRQFNGSIKDMTISNSTISFEKVKSNWITIQNSLKTNP